MSWMPAINPSNTAGINWDKAFALYLKALSCNDDKSHAKATLELAHLSTHAPQPILAKTVPLLAKLLTSGPLAQKAAAYALSCLARSHDGCLCPVIGQNGTIESLLQLLPMSEGVHRKFILKCVADLVSFHTENRLIAAKNGAVAVVLNLLSLCVDDSARVYLFEILTALALQIEGRREIVSSGGIHYLLEAVSFGKMVSRIRAAHVAGLLGGTPSLRQTLVDLGAVPVLMGLLRECELQKDRIVVGNALGIATCHAEYISEVAEDGVIPVFVEFLKGEDGFGKDIAEDVLCVLAVEEEHAVVICKHIIEVLEGDDEPSKLSALFILRRIVTYEHSIPVVRASGAISLVVEFLASGSEDLKVRALQVIVKLSAKKDNREALVDAGVIRLLIDVLKGDTEYLHEDATRSITSFTRDPLYRARVSEAYSIECFLEIKGRLAYLQSFGELMLRRW